MASLRIGRSLLWGSILALFCFFITLYSTHDKSPQQSPSQVARNLLAKLAPAKTTTVEIQAGDSLARIFQQHKIPYTQLQQLLKDPRAKSILSQLSIGKTLTLSLDTNNTLTALTYPFDPIHTLYIQKHKNQLTTTIDTATSKRISTYRSGTITSTLAQAMHTAGISSRLANQFEKIFQGNVNFSTDLRKGDQFKIIYDEHLINGQANHQGQIQLAELTNRGKTYKAIHYTYPNNHSGYYTPEGKGVTPLFLQYPLKFKRISSLFSYHRLNPITHEVRPHFGVDFAAPRGTPIHSVGDGKVIFAGDNKGYGNCVIIRYGKKYRGLYAHMQRFAKGIRSGITVKKGQLIGYVGSTGWSTGPHLHFGWYVNGIPKDPLKRPFLYSPAIPKSHQADFTAHARRLLNKLKQDEANTHLVSD